MKVGERRNNLLWECWLYCLLKDLMIVGGTLWRQGYWDKPGDCLWWKEAEEEVPLAKTSPKWNSWWYFMIVKI